MFRRDKFYDTVEREGATIATVESNKHMSFIRRNCGWFVNSAPVQSFMILCIVINGIMMGIATYPFVRLDPHVSKIFKFIDLIFLIIFTIELILQTIYRGLYLFTDGWLCFDFFIIVSSWAFSKVQIIRAFRIFRALRLAGRIKPMRDVITAIASVLPKLGSVFFLLVLVFYIFAVVFTSFYKDMYRLGQTETDYFSSLDVTAFTLFQLMCMDDWSQVAREVMATHKSAWALFVVYILVSAFVFTNMLVAVICDSVYTLREIDDLDEEEASKGSSEIPLKEIKKDVQCLEKHMNHAIRSQERTAHMIEYFSRQIKIKTGNV